MSATDQPNVDHPSLGDDPVLTALAGVVRALRTYAVSHPELRAQLAVLGKALLEIAEAPPALAMQEAPADLADHANVSAATAPLTPAPELPVPPPLASPSTPVVVPLSPPASYEDLQRLARVLAGLEPRPFEVEDAQSDRPIAPVMPTSIDDSVDLQSVVDHCALKAAVAHWCGTRSTIDQAALPESLAARARAMPECRLWMLRVNATAAIAPAFGPMLAGCFQAMAEVAELILGIEAQAVSSAMIQTILQLAAEVQSALRAALSVVQPSTTRDADQEALFRWVRMRAERDQIYIPRYMRKNDWADWEGWAERLDRIRAVSATVDRRLQQRRYERKLLGRLRHQLQVGLPAASDAVAIEAMWWRIDEVLSALITNGMPPSNKNLRTLLTPRLALLPPELSLGPQAQLVVRTVNDYNAAHPSLAVEQELAEAVADPSLSAVAALLRDRTVVFIGGDRRPYMADAIEEAFDLAELVWCNTQEGQSYLTMQPYIARPEVCLVILAIRWASHNLSEVSTFCDRYNKPLVRLPAGYNVSQIAHQVLQQAGERLRQTIA